MENKVRGVPLITTPTMMQISVGRNPQTEIRSKNMKRHEPRQTKTDPGV